MGIRELAVQLMLTSVKRYVLPRLAELAAKTKLKVDDQLVAKVREWLDSDALVDFLVSGEIDFAALRKMAADAVLKLLFDYALPKLREFAATTQTGLDDYAVDKLAELLDSPAFLNFLTDGK